MRTNKCMNSQFSEIVRTSTSYAQILKRLGYKQAGGNHEIVKKYIEKLQLDTSHLKGQAWSQGKKFGYRRPVSDYLSNQCFIHSDALKKRLLAENIFEHRCQRCTNTEWQGNPMPIELHHIDGNHQNNSLDNLQILCPNCHALTHNHKGRNKGKSGPERNRTSIAK